MSILNFLSLANQMKHRILNWEYLFIQVHSFWFLHYCQSIYLFLLFFSPSSLPCDSICRCFKWFIREGKLESATLSNPILHASLPCIYWFIFLIISLYVSLSLSLSLSLSIYIYIYIYAYIHTYTHKCMYMYIYIHIYMHTYTYIHAYIYAHTHTHTHTHTHIYIYINVSR